MDTQRHTMQELFAQLGLPDDEAAIKRFIAEHGPLPDHRLIYDAPFWTDAQAAFLREQLKEDGDWAMVIDELNVGLHAHTPPAELPTAGHQPTRVDSGPALQGEGNYTAAQHYDASTRRYVNTHDVEAAGRAAAPADADEAAEMEHAEQVGKAKARH